MRNVVRVHEKSREDTRNEGGQAGDARRVATPDRDASSCPCQEGAMMGFQAFLAENLLCALEPLTLLSFRH